MRNKIQLIGNLGADPEVKESAKGTKYVRLSLATSEYYTNASKERVEETNWHNVTLWGSLAESTEKHLNKGDVLAVEGRLKNNNYTDKNGDKHYSNEIIAHEYQLLRKKQLENAS